MKFKEESNKVKLYDKTNSNNGFKVLVGVGMLILTGVIALTISIGQQGMPTDADISSAPIDSETMTTPPVSTYPENAFSIKVTAPVPKAVKETTTAIETLPDGTTVYIQTNAAAFEGRYDSKDDAAKAKPTAPPADAPKPKVVQETTAATTAPPVTTAAPTTTKGGKDGEVFVPGFGWMKPSVGQGEPSVGSGSMDVKVGY